MMTRTIREVILAQGRVYFNRISFINMIRWKIIFVFLITCFRNLWSRIDVLMSRCMERHWFESNGRWGYFSLDFQATPNPYSIHGTSYGHPTNRLSCQPILVRDCSKSSFYHDIGIPLVLFIRKINKSERTKLFLNPYKLLRWDKKQNKTAEATKPRIYEDIKHIKVKSR